MSDMSKSDNNYNFLLTDIRFLVICFHKIQSISNNGITV